MTKHFSANNLGKTNDKSSKNNGKTILKVSFFLIGTVLIFVFSATMVSGFKNIRSSLKENTLGIISKTVGTSMQLDENNNINILLLGY